MKPRTKKEKLIMELSRKLPPITKAQRDYVAEHCLEQSAFMGKRTGWCSECGSSMPFAMNEAVCPACGKKLKVENRVCRKDERKVYYSVFTTCHGFQVIRHFVVDVIRKRGENKQVFIDEAVQVWMDESGRCTIVARPCGMCRYTFDSWQFDKPMSIKSGDPLGYYSKYDIWSVCTFPKGKILPVLRRNGYSMEIEKKGMERPVKIFRALLTDVRAETLLKTKQYSAFIYYMSFPAMPYYYAVNICTRHGYIIPDASIWVDLLRLLEYFHLDTHNPHYICPKDLWAAHDKLLERKQRIEKKQKEDEEREKAAKYEKAYLQAKGKFFGICFSDENIVVTVIQSVNEMAVEGREMHHCVYANHYFENNDSLILSAKNYDGQRIETVEVSLKNFSVVQSRGKFNKSTPFHDEILDLVNQNMNLIKAAI